MIDVIAHKECKIGGQGRAVRPNLNHLLVGFEKKYWGAEYYPCQKTEGNLNPGGEIKSRRAHSTALRM